MRTNILICIMAIIWTCPIYAASENSDSILADIEKTNAAIGYSLAEDIIVATVVANCAKYHPGIASRAKGARKSWQSNNKNLVDAAHAYLQAFSQLVARKTEMSAKAYYDQAKKQIMSEVAGSLSDLFPTASDVTDNKCDSLVTSLESGEFDFSRNKEFYPYLLDMKSVVQN